MMLKVLIRMIRVGIVILGVIVTVLVLVIVIVDS